MPRQRVRWGLTAPPPGTPIDWDRTPHSLRYAVVLDPWSGGQRTDILTTFDGGIAVRERVRAIKLPHEGPVPQQHPEGHRFAGSPTSQATAPWRIQFQGDNWAGNVNQDRITIAVRQWAQTTYGVGNGGRVIWNNSGGTADRLEAYTPLNPEGYGYWRFGNGTPGQGVVEFTQPALLTGFHSLVFSASTGVLHNPGMRVFMDGNVIASQDMWSGSKWTISPLSIGTGFWGVISYVYIFDDYITDPGFAEWLHREPYGIFAEPRKGYLGQPVGGRRAYAFAV
jgi:hypothetical protein